MTKEENKALLEIQFSIFKQKHRMYEELLKQFAQLDNDLKARQKQGEVFTKDHPDIERLLELGNSVGFGKYKSDRREDHRTKEFYDGVLLGLSYAIELLNND